MSKMSEERFNQTGSFDQYLSIHDLSLHPDWASAWESQDHAAIGEVLHYLGADVSYGWEYNMCLHRPRAGKSAVYGERFTFKERTDKAWMDSMMDITDVLRNTTGSIARTGMVLSLNNRIQNTFDETED